MAAIDELKNLQDLLGSRVNAMNPSLSYLNGLAGNAAGAYGNAIANQNTAEGLSPAAMSALRTQATSGINDQYQSAAQALNTQLLRRGAVGQNQLPGSGGDISRSYQPLYSAMEAAKTKATTDMILADEAAKRASLTENRANALSAANSVFGGANSIYNAQNAAISGTATIANDIASLESPDIWKLLGTSALTSALTGGLGGNGGSGGLFSGTGTNDTGKFGVVGDLIGGLFGGGGSEINSSGGVGNVTYGPNLPTNTGQNNGSGLVKNIENGVGTVGSAIVSGATDVGSAIGSGASALGNAAVHLLTNPYTAVVGGAILAATAWIKSQAHWEANTWTGGYQKPFDDKMADIQQKANQLKASGQMTPEAAQQIQSSVQPIMQKYLQDLDTFYREKGTSSDQSKVAAQAYQTFLKYYGEGGQTFLRNLVA